MYSFLAGLWIQLRTRYSMNRDNPVGMSKIVIYCPWRLVKLFLNSSNIKQDYHYTTLIPNPLNKTQSLYEAYLIVYDEFY